MTIPVVGTVAEDLYASLGPWSQLDAEEARYQVLEICEAVFGTTRLQELEDIVRDSETGIGWSPVMDPTRAPEVWLDWLGQFAGVRPILGLDEATKRQRVIDHANFRTGTPAAIVAELQQELTDTKTVIMNERVGGNGWQLAIRTYIAETPDEDLALAAILRQKPAGIVLDYATTTPESWTYGDLRVAYDLYSDVDAAFATYGDLADNDPI